MIVTLPLAYETQGRRRKSDGWRRARIIERVTFDIPELDSGEAQLAVEGMRLRDHYRDVGTANVLWIEGRAYSPDRMPGCVVPPQPFGSEEGHVIEKGLAFQRHAAARMPGFYRGAAVKGESAYSPARYRDLEAGPRDAALAALSEFVAGLRIVDGTLHYASGAPCYVVELRDVRMDFGVATPGEGGPHRFRLDRRDDAVEFLARLRELHGYDRDVTEILGLMPPEPLVLVPEAADFDDETASLPAAAQEALDFLGRYRDAFTGRTGFAYFWLMTAVEEFEADGDPDWLDAIAERLRDLDEAFAAAAPGIGMGLVQAAAEAGLAARRWNDRPILDGGHLSP